MGNCNPNNKSMHAIKFLCSKCTDIVKKFCGPIGFTVRDSTVRVN